MKSIDKDGSDAVERTDAKATQTWIVGPYPTGRTSHKRDGRSPEARITEAVALGDAIDLDVRDSVVVSLGTVRPATFLGKGKVDELAERCEELGIELVAMDCALSPVQQRNLEKAWGAKVIDRTGLILEIFGRRARTKEGTLQVELAHLAYQKSRLVRSWTISSGSGAASASWAAPAKRRSRRTGA